MTRERVSAVVAGMVLIDSSDSFTQSNDGEVEIEIGELAQVAFEEEEEEELLVVKLGMAVS